MASFRMSDHDADVMVVSEAADLRGLFEAAALGMTACLAGRAELEGRCARRLEVEGGSGEELLVHWLKGWLDLFNSEGFLGAAFAVEELTGSRAAGGARGEIFDPARHTIVREIKGITWHGLKLEEREGLWRASVILDV